MTKQQHIGSKWLGVLRLSVVGLLMLLMVSLALAQGTANTAPAQGRQISLRKQLTKGLRATKKADFEFLDRVVKAVEQGRLPRKMVDATFLWSRNRAARKSYVRRLRPMVYFQPGLTAQAKRIGVKL